MILYYDQSLRHSSAKVTVCVHLKVLFDIGSISGTLKIPSTLKINAGNVMLM